METPIRRTTRASPGRLLPRREIGGMGAADILVIVIIADAVQNAMAGGYESITEGLLLAAVIFGWPSLIDWLDYRFPGLHIASASEVEAAYIEGDGHFSVIRRGAAPMRPARKDGATRG